MLHILPWLGPYSPYLINGNLFWLAIAAAVINIFPSAALGRVLHTGRFLFHHYVYGFFVLCTSAAFIEFFTPVPLLNLFFIDSNDFHINAGRFLLLVGLTLFLDDLPDVSKRVEAGLNWMKTKAYQIRKPLHALQVFTGASQSTAAYLLHSQRYSKTQPVPANSFLIVSLFNRHNVLCPCQTKGMAKNNVARA